MRKTRTPWVTLAAGLCIASHFAQASQLSFADSWQDKGVDTVIHSYGYTYQYYSVKTVGSFSVNISLPLNGVDLREADAGTQFSFSIGPAGGTVPIISDTLGDSENYSVGKTSATFPLTDPNIGYTIGHLTVSWTATTITVTGSASEDILGEEQMFVSESPGAPTNYTLNTSKTGIYCETSLTLDASDNGGGTYNYDNPYVQAAGSDRETEFKPPDGSGPYPLETGSITGTGDFTPPTLAISSPTAGFKVYDADPVIDLVGLAGDLQSVTNIQCYVNGNTNFPIGIDQSHELPTNKISWTAEADLSKFGIVGSNLVTVVAQDLSGNQISVSRAFFWIETNAAVVSVNPTAAGTIKGVTNGQVLQVGTGYSVTAVPANTNWIFSDWTGASQVVLSSNATFEYVDQTSTLTSKSPPTLIANFVPNPFNKSTIAGAYSGLFYDTNNGLQVSDAGYITLSVKNTGAYSGKLYLATAASPFSLAGQLAEAPDGSSATAEVSIMAGKSEYLAVNLRVATDPNMADPGAGRLGGAVNSFSDVSEHNPLDSAQIQGERSIYKAGVIPGLYNVVISPVSTNPALGPGGYSYGCATVGKTGAVTLALILADGTSMPISFGSSLAQDGTCPFYAPLYAGKGVILGWMQFLTDGSGNMQQQPINWVKLPVAGKFYTNGFNAAKADAPVTISGGLYVPPKPGTNVFGGGATALTFKIDPGYTGLSLPDEIDVPVMFNPAKNTFTPSSAVTITLASTTGKLNGAFPAGGATYSYHGVQVDFAGFGFYVDMANKETGPIWIEPPQLIAFPGVDGATVIDSGGDQSVSSGAVDTSINVSVPVLAAPPESP